MQVDERVERRRRAVGVPQIGEVRRHLLTRGHRGLGIVGVVEALLDGIAGELDTVVHLQLAQGVLHVVLHGAVGEHESLGDLLVGHPLGDHLEDLGLPLGQLRGVGVLARPGSAIRRNSPSTSPASPGVNTVSPAATPRTAADELLARRGLDQIARGAGLDGLEHVVLLARRREDQDPGRRVLAQHLGGHLDAVGAGDLEVEHDDLRPGRGEPGQRLVTVGGDPDHVEAGGLQVTLDGVAPHRVVVDDHHPDRRSSGCDSMSGPYRGPAALSPMAGDSGRAGAPAPRRRRPAPRRRRR